MNGRTETLPLLLAAALIAPAPSPADDDNIAIETPLGGWRNSQGEQVIYTQEVHYPASAVSTQEEQSETAVIRGHILNADKHKGQPYKLIVNGVPMPLRVDEYGAFSRPYAFGTGSNNVEIRSPDGADRSRVQFYEAYTGKTQPKIRILLSWDSDGTDLDLHVVTPDGQHCYYGEPVIANGGALDVDVTTGYGPEIFSIAAPLPGAYQVYVNYYGWFEDGADLTLAQVAIVTDENTPNEKKRIVQLPMRRPGDLLLADSFVYP